MDLLENQHGIIRFQFRICFLNFIFDFYFFLQISIFLSFSLHFFTNSSRKYFLFSHFLDQITFKMNYDHSMNSSQSTLNPSDDSSSPYYRHSSDNHSTLLVYKIFIGDNYIAWSRSIIIALIVKSKVTFINGSNLVPLIDQRVHHII